VREIAVQRLEAAVETLIRRSAYHLPDDYLEALAAAQDRENSRLGRNIIGMLRENAAYAEAERIPTCQDTGMAVVHLQMGQDVHFVDGDLEAAIEKGVRQGYSSLRHSVVSDPLERENSGDNTPAVIHYQLVPGQEVKLTVMMKGFGAELMSRLKMLPPSAGIEGVKRFVLETVERAGPNACPPIIVGVGLGSTFEGVAFWPRRP